MPVGVGEIVEGTVTGITNFGAFVQLPGGETGLVHISEIADTYVKDIRNYLSHNEKIQVKVIGIEKGKISLSIRQIKHKKILNRLNIARTQIEESLKCLLKISWLNF